MHSAQGNAIDPEVLLLVIGRFLHDYASGTLELGPHAYPEPAEVFRIYDGCLDYVARRGLTSEAANLPVLADLAALAVMLPSVASGATQTQEGRISIFRNLVDSEHGFPNPMSPAHWVGSLGAVGGIVAEEGRQACVICPLFQVFFGLPPARGAGDREARIVFDPAA